MLTTFSRMNPPLPLMVFVLTLGCQASAVAESVIPSKPDWIDSPQKSGYIRIVGSAPRQADGNESTQYRIAMMKARQEMAQMVRVRVQNTIEQTATHSSGAVSVTANSASRLTSRAAIPGDAQVVAQWIAPESGVLYLLLELAE